jgi:hypothetical protein
MKNRGLWFLARAVATLILIGLLVGGGFALYYAGVFKGYAASELVAAGEEAAKPAFLPESLPPFRYHHYRPFGVIGMLFKIVLFFIFIGIIAKLIRFVVWGSVFRHGWCGPWGKHWHGPHWAHGPHARRAYRRHARHHRHGPPMPPWFWDWDEDEDEEDAGDEPETD